MISLTLFHRTSTCIFFFCFLEETVTNDNKFIQNNCALPTFTNFTEIKNYEKMPAS